MNPTPTFVHDAITWRMYGTLGLFAYLLYGLGAIMPFLRQDLALSPMMAGGHSSCSAIGMIISGLFGERLTSLWGRPRMIWFGVGSLVFGGVLLTLGHHTAITLVSSSLIGWGGGLVGMLVSATLSDQHDEQRSIALTEANLVASASGIMAPLWIGLGETTGVGWRVAFHLPVVVAVVFLVVFSLRTTRTRGVIKQSTKGRLPLAYWLYWFLIVLVVWAEFGMVFWGAPYLSLVTGLSIATATSMMSLFLGAMLVGRLIGSRLCRRYPTSRVLRWSLLVAIFGFAFYWLVPSAPIVLIGLTFIGLGLGSLYPLSLSLAISTADTASDTASARSFMASGIAILVGPLLLGAAAEEVGLARAQATIGAIIVAAICLSYVVGLSHACRSRDENR